MPADPHPPRGIDVTKPSVARVYDYALGGDQNYPIDRQHAEEFFTHYPELKVLAKQNRAFLIRAVRHLAADLGIRQFLDFGSGLPTQQNVHQVAQAYRPDARVVYVDNDPIVLAHSRALLSDREHTTYIEADMRDPQVVLNHPDTRRLLDFTQPIAALFISTLHYIADGDDPAGIVAQVVRALPSGSWLLITHVTEDGADAPPEWLEQQKRAYNGGQYERPLDEIEAMFDGAEIIAPLTDIQLMFPDETSGAPRGPQRVVGAFARVR